MSAGCFRVLRNPDDDRDILFEVAIFDGSLIPENQMAFQSDVNETVIALRTLFPRDDPRFERYFSPLLMLAQTGLVGEHAQQDLAAQNLASLKEEIAIREGGKIKNRYMERLGWRALFLGVITLISALMVHFLWSDQQILANFLFLWTACMAGVWVSFGARKTTIRFENLTVLEEDRLEPLIRLVFAGLLTIIIGLLFATETVILQVGAISTAEIVNTITVALLIGVLCGFSEQALPATVTRQASTIIDLGRI